MVQYGREGKAEGRNAGGGLEWSGERELVEDIGFRDDDNEENAEGKGRRRSCGTISTVGG